MNNVEYKRYLKRKYLKSLRHKKRLAKRKKNKLNKDIIYKLKFKDKFKAPKNFSIKENPIETVDFFNKIILKITDAENVSLALDMRNITNVTSDAIIYILAILYSTRKNNIEHFEVVGFFPKKRELFLEFDKCGFNKFLKNKYSNDITTSRQNIEVINGNKVDRMIVKEICDFVQLKFSVSKTETLILFNILFEMMLNTYQHAYEKEDRFKNEWYIYIEYSNNCCKFVFLDTGEGIIKTINKKVLEKFNFNIEHNALLTSTLNGQSRSSTGLKSRNRGLPSILKSYQSGYIKDLSIITDKAVCEFGQNQNCFDNEHGFVGTLYFWTVDEKSLRRKKNDL